MAHRRKKSIAPPAAPGRRKGCPLFASEDDVIARLLASMMGMPRICVVRECRRRKRCLGADFVCWKHHRGLAGKRMHGAIARLTAPAGREP